MPIPPDFDLSPVGPISSRVSFTFDPGVNVLIGPNGSGKSTVLTGIKRTAEETHGQDPDDPEGPINWSFDEKWGPIILVPAIRLPFPPTYNVISGYANLQSFVSAGHVLDGRLVFRKFQYFRENMMNLMGTYSTDYDQREDLDRILENQKRTIAQRVFDCASYICGDILENRIPSEHVYRPDPSDRQGGINEVTYDYWRVYTTDYVRDPITIGDLSSGTQGSVMWLLHMAHSLYERFIHRVGHIGVDRYPTRRLSPFFPKGEWWEMPFVLLIDEIENHLHPTWQRRVIPALRKFFPNIQIIATTHSPFVVAGLKAGQVHLLKRDADGVVTASTNTEDIVGWTADEILRVYMGVDEPTDETTAQAARELRLLRDEAPRADEREEEERQAEILRLRQIVDRSELSGPRAAEDARFLADLRSILHRYDQEQNLNQENG